MANLPISREEALVLLKKYNPIENKSDWNHYLESEAIMGELAKRLNENENYWKFLGLLHDVDWGITKNNSVEHLTKAQVILKEVGFDDKFIQIIISHGYGFNCANLENQKRTKKEEFALAASETLTGLIHSYALMRGKKISDMEVSGLKKKFKDKAFAAGVNREIIKEIENLGITIDEFLKIGIDAIKNIKSEVGLE